MNKDFWQGFFIAIVLYSAILAVYLCKMNFQYTSGKYEWVIQQINLLKKQ